MLVNPNASDSLKDTLRDIIVYLKKEYGFVEKPAFKAALFRKSVQTKSKAVIDRIIDKIISVQEYKFNSFKKETVEEENHLQIRIFGACISYTQLKLLMH